MILEGVLAAFTIWELLSGRKSQPQAAPLHQMAAAPSPPAPVGFRPDQIARFTFREPSRALVFAPNLAEPLLRELDRHSVVELQMPAGMRAWQVCPLNPELPHAATVIRQALAQGRAVAATVSLMALANAPVPVAIIAGPADTIDAIAATSDYAVLARPSPVATKERATEVMGPPVKPLSQVEPAEPPPVAEVVAPPVVVTEPAAPAPAPAPAPKAKRKSTKRKTAKSAAAHDKGLNGVGPHVMPHVTPEVLPS